MPRCDCRRRRRRRRLVYGRAEGRFGRRPRLHRVVRVLSDAALVAARTRLNLAAGVLLRAVWARRHRPAGSDRPSLGRRWRVMANLLEDINIAWAQHHSGAPINLPRGGTSFARWSAVLEGMRTAPRCWSRPTSGARWCGPGGPCPPCSRIAIPMPVPVRRRCRWTPPPRGGCSARCPRRSTPVCGHFVDRLRAGLGREFLGTGSAPIGIDVEGPRP